ncbi:MAG: fold metallo-hydrolase [Gemmatimonadetes bacterium]|nr:fold metallo-hydrolase [Gemmatimonadota bacterium]
MRRLAAVLVITAATALHAQQDFSQVKIIVVPVAKGVYMLQGSGGNIGLSVGNDDAFVIDDEYAPLTPRIKAAIATVTAKPVRFVVNTHWHGDHTGGNENMAAGGAILVAHDNVRKRMSAEQFIEAFKQTVPASPAAALPVITFNESISFWVNGDSVRATHVQNAHTDGDAIIFFQGANVLHMGDTFFNGFYPFIDVSSGGTLDGIIAAADRGLAMADASTKIIPGHGELGDRASLKKYRDVMAGSRDRIAKLITQKKTLAQIIAAKPLADYDSTWGQGFMKPDQFITMVHAGMTKKADPKVSSQHHEE